ncbi:MAG: hypothetical protein RIB61_17175, partial [Roseicyclus sp.]
ARVMRPRRVRVDASRRRTSDRPSPLVLVSEQRIDEDPLGTAQPVRPRRVSTADIDMASTTQSTGNALRLADIEPSEDSASTANGQRPVQEGEGSRPQRRVVNSLAVLAQRAGLIMRANRGGNAAEDLSDEMHLEMEVSDHELDDAPVADDADMGRTAEVIDVHGDQAGFEPAKAGHDDEEETINHPARFAVRLENSNAIEIEEVVELAATYALVEFGQPYFDRPELFRLIGDATDNSINREDLLEAFGSLVRQGRILRLSRGRFVLSAD